MTCRRLLVRKSKTMKRKIKKVFKKRPFEHLPKANS
nr:MAG TPA: hypothetical protein [Caudoviricetes sp.]